jgi:hypothetical protein
MNLAHKWVSDQGKCLPGTREEYDGACIDFAGELADTTPGARLAYFETPFNANWRYHAAMELNGIIHDLWQEEPMSLADFMEAIGANSVEYPAEEPQPA